MTLRLDAVVRTLQKRYGAIESPPEEAFALFVWEILSGHTTTSKRDAAFRALKRHRLKPLPRMTGESSAYRMLLFAGKQTVFPVDARVARVATRLGYGEALGHFSKTARSVRQALAAELPDSVEQFRRAYLYLEHHGAVTCTESDPRCGTCSLRTGCEYPRQQAH